MLKKPYSILAFLIATGLFIYYCINLYQFLFKSYYIDETKLYRIDTFHLLDRAYESSDGGGSKVSSPESKLIFESINRYSFAIDKNIYKAIIDKKKLEDTLMYYDTKFTVFSDKETYDKYQKSKAPIFIRVYQIQIGDTKYIDVSEMNNISKAGKKAGVLAPLLAIYFISFISLTKIDWWTNWKIIICGIAFIVLIVVLVLSP